MIATFYGFIYLLEMLNDWQITDYANSAKPLVGQPDQ